MEYFIESNILLTGYIKFDCVPIKDLYIKHQKLNVPYYLKKTCLFKICQLYV